jgi:hypothetical protein
MRDILFRGKTKEGNWVTGSYIRGAKYFINVREDEQQYEVIPESIGEYTGMYDVYGNRIFEGDIVQSLFNGIPYKTGKIIFQYSKFVFETPSDYSEMISCDFQIIGNIYDNPELYREEVKK